MERLLQFFVTHLNPLQVITEVIRIFPDALIWGIGFFSTITLSYPFFVLFISLIEALIIYYGLRSFNTWLGVLPERVTKDASYLKCRTGFSSVTVESLSLFGSDRLLAFPSAPIYIVSVAVSYILSMLITFKNELELLGTSYASRLYLSTIGLSSLLFLLMAYRSVYSCDTFIVIVASLIIGLAVGALILQQNRLLGGEKSINMLGIPLLYNSTASGSPMYVCNKPAPNV
jgi:hypothetical protein